MDNNINLDTNDLNKNNIQKVCLFSNSFEDALYHHRIAAPLQHSGISLSNGVENGVVVPSRLLDGDIVVLQRDFPRDIYKYEEVLNLARKHNKPIIFDLDDLIFSLEEAHPDRQSQLYTDSLLPMFQTLFEVDLVSVSTPKLKDVLLSYNPNIAVLPNYLDDNIWSFREPEENSNNEDSVTIGYMGTESHMPDLDLITPVLENLLIAYPGKVKLDFWGIEPPKILKTHAMVNWTSFQDYRYKNFVEDFQKIQADIFIAPLVDHLFNQCKSPIKFFEYSALGIPGVYSKLEPYESVVTHGTNGYLASSLEDWQHFLAMLIEDKGLRHSIARNAQQTVQKKWVLSKNYSKWRIEYQLLFDSMNVPGHQKKISKKLIRSITEQLFEQQEKSKLALDDALLKVKEVTQELILREEQYKKIDKKNNGLIIQINAQKDLIEGQNKKIEEKEESLVRLNASFIETQSKADYLEQANIDLKVSKKDLQNRLEIANRKILDSTEKLKHLSQEIIEKDQTNLQMSDQLNARDDEIFHLNNQNLSILQELTGIKNSKTYKFAQSLINISNKIFPSDGLLLRSIKRILNIIVLPIRKLIKKIRLRKDVQLIRKSLFFSEEYYFENNPDVKESGVDPAEHYMYFGGFEGRDPGPEFSSRGYLDLNLDVRQSGINPLVHFLKFGIYEGRNPKVLTATQVGTIIKSGVDKKLENNEDYLTDPKDPGKTAVSEKAIPLNTKYFQAYSNLQKFSEGDRLPEYMPLLEKGIKNPEDIVKLIAFYLPQFHPFPENDNWWGRGFTEWTNVSKAVPQFVGHNQPHLPGELGFYDLRLYDVQRRQIELAKLYGIYGFCFHYYWFSGKRLLEKPLNQFLEHTENNFPFCICWANENWTRRWDGQEDDILISQVHSYENDKNFIADLKPLLLDPRYIKINGRPVIVVYRPSLLKEPQKTSAYWREYCQQNGLGIPYLVAAQTFGVSDPRIFGFDAAVEFPPHNIVYQNIKPSMQMLNDSHKGSIYDYREMVAKNMRPKKEKFRVIRTTCPGWDNEPRKPGRGNSFAFTSPTMYRRWLEQICLSEIITYPKEERMVFINAWNEWGEGAYLEPDRKYGYAYLQATREAIQDNSNVGFLTKDRDWVLHPLKKHDTAVILHIYYTELFNEIADYLKNLQSEFDLYVSIPDSKSDFSSDVLKRFPEAQILIVENKGRDIAPFIKIYRSIKELNYSFILKLHSKKSMHREDGDAWRNDIYKKLVGNNETIKEIKKSLAERNFVGIIGPKKHVLDHRVYWGFNKYTTLRMASDVGIACIEDPEFNFIAGSMFWAKPDALSLLDLLPVNTNDFEPEPTPPDGALAHAVERFIGLAATVSGYDIMEIDEFGVITKPDSGNLYPFAQPYPQ